MSRSFSYGGQALLEGVMIRARHCATIAVRRSDGEIVHHREELGNVLNSRAAKLPFIRGILVLWETLIVGTKALMFSANVSASEEGEELSTGMIVPMLVVSLVVAVAIFFVSPLLVAAWLEPVLGPVWIHVFEGVLRLLLFVGYVWGIGLTSDIRRVYQYHGAEHMTIHAHEHGTPLTVEEIRRFPTAHPRCGTAFLLLVALISIALFAAIGTPSIEIRILSRIVLVPVVASLAYELLKVGARYQSNPIMWLLVAPGLWLQAITTKPPADDQIEVAIEAMNAALAADAGETVEIG